MITQVYCGIHLGYNYLGKLGEYMDYIYTDESYIRYSKIKLMQQKIINNVVAYSHKALILVPIIKDEPLDYESYMRITHQNVLKSVRYDHQDLREKLGDRLVILDDFQMPFNYRSQRIDRLFPTLEYIRSRINFEYNQNQLELFGFGEYSDQCLPINMVSISCALGLPYNYEIISEASIGNNLRTLSGPPDKIDEMWPLK